MYNLQVFFVFLLLCNMFISLKHNKQIKMTISLQDFPDDSSGKSNNIFKISPIKINKKSDPFVVFKHLTVGSGNDERYNTTDFNETMLYNIRKNIRLKNILHKLESDNICVQEKLNIIHAENIISTSMSPNLLVGLNVTNF